VQGQIEGLGISTDIPQGAPMKNDGHLGLGQRLPERLVGGVVIATFRVLKQGKGHAACPLRPSRQLDGLTHFIHIQKEHRPGLGHALAEFAHP
jgi:hypothetical protein